jgi:hypothetical protein
MRIRRPISRENGAGLLLAGGVESAVRYELITWGTFEGDQQCASERNGALEGGSDWPSGVAVLRLEDGQARRILLRKCGTFAMCE